MFKKRVLSKRKKLKESKVNLKKKLWKSGWSFVLRSKKMDQGDMVDGKNENYEEILKNRNEILPHNTIYEDEDQQKLLFYQKTSRRFAICENDITERLGLLQVLNHCINLRSVYTDGMV